MFVSDIELPLLSLADEKSESINFLSFFSFSLLKNLLMLGRIGASFLAFFDRHFALDALDHSDTIMMHKLCMFLMHMCYYANCYCNSRY